MRKKRKTYKIWLFDYNEDSGELEFHVSNKSIWNGVPCSIWNGVPCSIEEANRMMNEFNSTGKTEWAGQDYHLTFVRGQDPEWTRNKK